MRTRIALIFPLLCAPLAFWACGDDAGNDSNGSESAGCTVSENKDGSYTVSCADGTEAVLHDGEDGNDGTDGKDGSSCTVVVSKDSSTYILICDGKVVGEISDGSDGKDGKDGLDGNDGKNGKDGADGSDGKNGKDGADGASCTVADTTDASTGRTGYNLVCDGERKGIVWNGVDGKDAMDPAHSSSSGVQNPDIVEIKNMSITGESQFVTGSTVKLYELDGETLAQTGKSFAGKIINDNGELKISSVTLASQYALLEASGYYRNVVKGKKSSGTITLNALVDLSDREKVNINMLTHLEYERVCYLVGTGMKVPAAKKQAETEILGAFGIEGNFANSEDLHIFGEGEGEAVLLAVSVLMQGDRNEVALTELLSKIAIDIEKDGEWNDETIKTQIADWSEINDLESYYYGLELIRSNIEGWNLGPVQNFEKYVRNFWYVVYGLGACGVLNNGEVAAVSNELVKIYGSDIRYICKDGVWIEATDIEKDTYLWTAGEDGEIRSGEIIPKNKYKYDESLGMWIVADLVDETLNRACVASRNDEAEELNYAYFVCEGTSWRMKEVNEVLDNKPCTSADEGEILYVRSSAKNGISGYYCSASGWLDVDEWRWNVPKEVYSNPEISYGTMIDSRDGQVYKTVKIGDQVWMAENLNYADSTKIPSLKGKSWSYDNKAENCDVAGRLYTWAAAIDSVALANDADNPQTCGNGKTCMLPTVVQGVCPSGWHLPTSAEWNTLFTAVGGSSGSAGAILVSGSGWNGNGTDAYGFSALPAGYRNYSGSFYSAGYRAYFWSATHDSYDADYVILEGGATLLSHTMRSGYSVRCLQN